MIFKRIVPDEYYLSSRVPCGGW